jgi:hypothetical protein
MACGFEEIDGASTVVKMDISLHALPGLPRTVIVMEINFIVFQAAPESLNDDVIRSTPFAIHADTPFILL